MPRRLPRRVYLTFADIGTNRRFARFHRWLLRRSGRRGPASTFLGLQIVLLTTTGRRSGEPRTVPVGAVRHGDRWLVMGSNAGRDKPPAWALNLTANPSVTVDSGIGAEHYQAHAADGEEAARLWPIAIAAYPGYLVYQTRTDRVLPLIVLEPVGQT